MAASAAGLAGALAGCSGAGGVVVIVVVLRLQVGQLLLEAAQTLVLLGPLHERTLVTILLGFQVACSVVVLAFRHTIAEYFF